MADRRGRSRRGRTLGRLGGEPAATLGRPAAHARGLVVERLRHRAAARRWRAALPAALEDLARSLRSGASIEGAMAEVAASGHDPVRGDLRRVHDRMQAGEELALALRRWEASARDPVAGLPVTALLLAGESGGPRAWAVEQVAATLRERAAVEGELRGQVSQARLSAAVVVLSPLAFAALLLVVDARVLAFFLTPAGLLCALVGALLDGGGAWWMRRLVQEAV
jgi:tight adherence protein B